MSEKEIRDSEDFVRDMKKLERFSPVDAKKMKEAIKIMGAIAELAPAERKADKAGGAA